MPNYFVFIPMRETETTAEQIKQIRSEWKLYKHQMSVRVLGGRYDLSKVASGDVIYVHAHGYSNDYTTIGGDGGAQGVDAAGLLRAMVDGANLDASLSHLTIKIWACFSGFGFAKSFYNAATEEKMFPELKVHGYKGQTRTTQPQKSVMGQDNAVVRAKSLRVEYP